MAKIVRNHLSVGTIVWTALPVGGIPNLYEQEPSTVGIWQYRISKVTLNPDTGTCIYSAVNGNMSLKFSDDDLDGFVFLSRDKAVKYATYILAEKG